MASIIEREGGFVSSVNGKSSMDSTGLTRRQPDATRDYVRPASRNRTLSFVGAVASVKARGGERSERWEAAGTKSPNVVRGRSRLVIADRRDSRVWWAGELVEVNTAAMLVSARVDGAKVLSRARRGITKKVCGFY